MYIAKPHYSKAFRHPLFCPVSSLPSIHRLSTGCPRGCKHNGQSCLYPAPPSPGRTLSTVKNLPASVANGLQEKKDKSHVDPAPQLNKNLRFPARDPIPDTSSIFHHH